MDGFSAPASSSSSGARAAVERARAAREARARTAAAAANAAAESARHAAAHTLQRAAVRMTRESAAAAALLRSRWACPAEPPAAGAQVALLGWFLRFYDAERDASRLSKLCTLLLKGMGGEAREASLPYAALLRGLTRRWVEVLRGLVLACARQLGRPTARAQELGAPLRLLLCLAEPARWRVVRQMETEEGGAQLAAALRLMGEATRASAAAELVGALGALLRRPASAPPLERPVRAAVVGLGALIACPGPTAPAGPPTPPPTLEAASALLAGVLTVPALCAPGSLSSSSTPEPALERIRRGLWRALEAHGGALAIGVGEAVRREHGAEMAASAALALAGNMLSLTPQAGPDLPSPAARRAHARLLRALVELAGAGGSSGTGAVGASVYHPLLGWSGGAPSPALAASVDAVRQQLEALWSAPLLTLHFGGALYAPLAQRPAARAVLELAEQELGVLRDEAADAAELHLAALHALEPLRRCCLLYTSPSPRD